MPRKSVKSGKAGPSKKPCRLCDNPAEYGELCKMHYSRAYRKSPNAERPGKVRDGSRSAKVIFSCGEDFKDFLMEKAGAGRVSELCYTTLKLALGWPSDQDEQTAAK